MNPVSITRLGETYSGSYSVKNGMVRVEYAGKVKSTQISTAEPHVIAEMLLGEMIAA